MSSGLDQSIYLCVFVSGLPKRTDTPVQQPSAQSSSAERAIIFRRCLRQRRSSASSERGARRLDPVLQQDISAPDARLRASVRSFLWFSAGASLVKSRHSLPPNASSSRNAWYTFVHFFVETLRNLAERSLPIVFAQVGEWQLGILEPSPKTSAGDRAV